MHNQLLRNLLTQKKSMKMGSLFPESPYFQKMGLTSPSFVTSNTYTTTAFFFFEDQNISNHP